MRMAYVLRIIIISAYSMLILSGCSGHDEIPNTSFAIRLGASTHFDSRAPVNDLAGLSAVGTNVGLYGIVTTSGSASSLPAEDWAGIPLMNNVRTTSIDASTGSMSWTGNYTYPVEDGKSVRFLAYHPYASAGLSGNNYIIAPSSNRPPELHFTLTGNEDVMYASPVTGSKSITPGALVFNHVLTQIRFSIIDERGSFSGETLNSITFNGVNTTSSMNLESGALGAWGTSSDITFSGIDAPVSITGTANSPQELKSTIMLQPDLASFNLKVVTSKGSFESVVIRPTSGTNSGTSLDDRFAAGRSYLVKLTFRSLAELNITATVTPWIMDGTGEGVVE